MTPVELRQARKAKGWTQQEAASRLGLSQTYLSLLEKGKRQVPKSRVQRLLTVYDSLSPLALPMRGQKNWDRLDSLKLAQQLAALGYPGFAYMQSHATWNPAELLLAAVNQGRPGKPHGRSFALVGSCLQRHGLGLDGLANQDARCTEPPGICSYSCPIPGGENEEHRCGKPPPGRGKKLARFCSYARTHILP